VIDGIEFNEVAHQGGHKDIKTSETIETMVVVDAKVTLKLLDIQTYCYHRIIHTSLHISVLPCGKEGSVASRNALTSSTSMIYHRNTITLEMMNMLKLIGSLVM
jgi:hypothetical protein